MKTPTLKTFSLIVATLLLTFAGHTEAADSAPPKTAAASKAAPARAPASKSDSLQGDRNKSLDFDSEVVEGMNKNPLDSLTRVSKHDDKQQGHLYRRKSNFKREIRQTVQEMGYTQ